MSEFWETQKAKLSDKTLEVVEKLPKAYENMGEYGRRYCEYCHV